MAPPAGDDDVRLEPEAIAEREFPTARKGYDVDTVRAFLAAVGRSQRSLLDRLEEAERDAAAVLAAAEARSAEVLREAQDEARRQLSGVAAERERAHAEGVAAAEAERDALLAEARAEAAALVEEARAARQKVLGDLRRRRKAARVQVEQLHAARERLLAALGVVRGSIDATTRGLRDALPDAKQAADAAARRVEAEPETSVEQLEAEIEALRLAGLTFGGAGGAGSAAELGVEDEPDTGEVAVVDVGVPAPEVPAPDRRSSAVRIVRPLRAQDPVTGLPEGELTPVEAPDPVEEVRLLTVEDLAAAAAQLLAAEDGDAPAEEADAGAGAAGDDDPTDGPVPATPSDRSVGGAPVAPEGVAEAEADAIGGPLEEPATPPPVERGADLPAPTATSTASGDDDVTDRPVPAAPSDRSVGGAPVVPDGVAEAPADAGADVAPDADADAEAESVASGTADVGAPGTADVDADPADADPAEADRGDPADADVDSADADGGAAGGPTAEVGDPGGPTRPTTDTVDALFARLRSGRAERVAGAEAVLAEEDGAEPAGPDAEDEPDLEEQPSPEVVAEAVAALVTVDDVAVHRGGGPDREALLARRDALLAPAAAALARRLKRVLADEQNEVLDRLRRTGTEGAIGEADEHVGRWAQAAGPDLAHAASAGVHFGGEADEGGDRRTGPSPGDVAEIAEALAESVARPLHARLAALLEAAEGDEEHAASGVRAAYRTWRAERITSAADHAALDAFSLGVLQATAPGTPVRWVVDHVGAPSPDCEDNALEGDVPAGEPFPTGHLRPPAHPGCRCVLARPVDGA